MNALLVLVIAIIALVVGYLTYGRWLARQWGLDPNRTTPAHELEDGVDYVAAPPYVVLGHHFSSIAGAGPINGPIQAAVFGWVPVLLWVLIGGIFMGAAHDFGALFASIRHKGRSLATVINANIDETAKRLFCIFVILTLILVEAAFSSIVANTFAVLPNASEASNLANSRTAMISILFIAAAVIWGLVTRGRRLPVAANIVAAIAVIVAVVAIGYNLPIVKLDYLTWMLILGAYIFIAAVAPVWILLQPRDYLSSYLLYGMIALAVFGIVGAGVLGYVSDLDIPAFAGFFTTNAAVDASGAPILDANGAAVINKAAQGGYLFPALFITIACGAISGFHSLVASGTTSKQLDKESQALPIGYGSMLIECLLAVISLIAVGFVWTAYQAGEYAAPTAIFASGLSQIISLIPGLSGVEDITYSLLILAVSAFCLTSLDTVTRLGRYMFQELFQAEADTAGENPPAWRTVLTNKYVATFLIVICGIALGLTGYTVVWPLFGAANQLLAALALLAICSWLGNAGKNNKMFYIPMAFMMVVTLTSLGMTIQSNFSTVMVGGDVLIPAVRLIFATLLFVLAIILAVKGFKVVFGKRTAQKRAR